MDRVQEYRKKFEKNRKAYRGRLARRQGGVFCRRCGSREDVTVDHIQRLSDGGNNWLGNLQLLCRWCHDRKEEKYDEGEYPVKLFRGSL